MMESISNIRFADPLFFLLLLVIPLYLWYRKKYDHKRYVEFRMSNLDAVQYVKPSLKIRLISFLPWMRMLSFISIVIALARPQTDFSNKKYLSEGIDIMLAIDISNSMYAIDFKPNRMIVAKEAAKKFIDARAGDRIGMVVFAGEAFTQCPATLDHELLKRQIDAADNWQLEDGTALGDGLFMAVSRLSDTTHLSTKVIILLSDGVRTAGKFSPIDAANAAKQLNMRVYTIGVGSESTRPIPVVDKNGRVVYSLDPRTSFDEPTLQKVSELTGGQYFRVTKQEKLNEVYGEIDKIEKLKMETDMTKRYDEHFYGFAIAGIVLLLLELLLSNTILRTTT